MSSRRHDEISVGVVGLGKMGIAHAAILNALEGVKVRAAADSELIMRMGVGSVLKGVRMYGRYEKMLERENLDAVYITAPTSLHVGIGSDCLSAGLPFFIEKPLGVTAAEAAGLVEKARGGPVNMVGYCKHFIGTFEKAKELLDGGRLGNPIHLASSMYVSQMFASGSGWRYKKASSGGGVLNILATHLVDLLLWLFGPVEAVSGSVKSHYSSEVEDFVHAQLSFASGLSGFMDASWSVRGYRVPGIRIEVQCEGGSITVTDDYVKYSEDSVERVRQLYKQDLFAGVPIYVGGEEYTREDMHFMRCVRENEPTGIDVAYGYAVQQVTDAIYRSAETRAEVSPREVA